MINAKIYTKLGNIITRQKPLSELQANYIFCDEDHIWVHKSKELEILYVNGEPFCLKRNSSNYDLVLTVDNDFQLRSNCRTIITRGQPKFISGRMSLEEIRHNTQFAVSIRDRVIFLDSVVARSNQYMFCSTCNDYTEHIVSMCVPCQERIIEFRMTNGYEPTERELPIALSRIFPIEDLDGNIENNHTLFRYHNAKRVNLIGEEIFGIGFEVEKEDSSFSLNCHQLRSETGWVAETDSSLDSSSGFELISPALPLKIKKPIYEQVGWINKYIKPVEVYLKSSGSTSCGGCIGYPVQ